MAEWGTEHDIVRTRDALKAGYGPARTGRAGTHGERRFPGQKPASRVHGSRWGLARPLKKGR